MRAGERLRGAAQIGGEPLVPLTPAEEAILYLAPRLEAAVFFDVYSEPDPGSSERADAYRTEWLALPPDPEARDYDWLEVLEALTGDVDIELMWKAELDGIEDPEDELNADLGMGDYRPSRWHHVFSGRLPPH